MSALIPPKVDIGDGVSAAFEGTVLVLTHERQRPTWMPDVVSVEPCRLTLSPEALRKLDAYLWMAAGIRQRAQADD